MKLLLDTNIFLEVILGQEKARSVKDLLSGTAGLSPCGVLCNISFNEKRGTLHGMYYQI